MSRNNATWQQVSAPSLNGSVEALVSALKGAGSTINSTFQGVEDARKAGAVGELLQRSLGFNSPEEIQAAQQSGQLTQGIDQRYITPEFVKTLDDRVNAGFEQRNKALANDLYSQRLDIMRTDQEREAQKILQEKAAAPLMFEYQNLVKSGNIPALREWEAKNSGLLATLGAKGATLGDEGVSAIKGQVAGNVAGAIAAGFQSDPVGSIEAVGRLLSNQTPEEQILTKAALKKVNIPIDDPAFLAQMGEAKRLLGANPATAAISQAATPASVNLAQVDRDIETKLANTVLGNGAFGKPAKPISESTIAELAPFQKQLRDATAGNSKLKLPAGVGSSAIGAYQFTKQTIDDYGPRVFGKDWQNTVFNAANQELLAKAIFEDRKKQGNLVPTWQGLGTTPVLRAKYSNPGFVRNATWDQVKADILRTEAGATAPAFGTNGGVAAFGNPNVARQNPNNATPRAAEVIAQAATPTVPQQAQTFSGTADAITFDTSRIGQAFRDAGRADALATFGKEGITPYVEAMHKRTVRDDEDKTYENNVNFVNKNLPGDAKISQGELRTLYEKHTKGLSAAEKPDISVFSQMLIQSRDSSIAAPFTRMNMREDNLFDSFGGSATRYNPQALESKVKAFTPGALALRGELSKVVKEENKDSQTADVSVKTLKDTVTTLEKQISGAEAVGVQSGGLKVQLAIARASLAEAEQKARSKLSSAVGLTR